MKHYNINDDIIICDTWFGIAELHYDFNLFRDLEILKFLAEIEKMKSLAMKLKNISPLEKKMQEFTEIVNNFTKEYDLKIENIISLFSSAEKYMKYIDDLPNLAPESLKGKKLIITGLQTNAFSSPKIIQL